ncbi:hypothetical protein LSH36_1023g02106 [Paralvinella palmiformis]|uniref:Uncharacterized protein n=1 Tax=Paralvinella palmiformis TaxID=53620 RepID=A0AAD9IVZ2_9ANNE|nr:hypothetical protein LSH36_1023g02106 [Paralvinella palmiformis]
MLIRVTKCLPNYQTSNAVVLAPNSILCQVHSYELVSNVQVPNSVNSDCWLNKPYLSCSVLTEIQKSKMMELVTDWNNVFSKNDLDVDLPSLFRHRINIDDDTSFKQPHPKIPHSMYCEVRDHLKQLLNAGIIQKAKVLGRRTFVLVRKKRPIATSRCRQLKTRIVKDAYALPRIE